MNDETDKRLLDAFLDSWDRNNTILVNLLRSLPAGGLETRAMEGSPSIAELFTDLHYDHPILLLQHMLWHEGYHHGQIKLALKLAGRPIADAEAGPLTWGVWMRRS